MDAQLLERNIPKLILREIRWMGLIVDSMQLLEKLLSALPALPLSLQQDVIYILPEIASDEDSLVSSPVNSQDLFRLFTPLDLDRSWSRPC